MTWLEYPSTIHIVACICVKSARCSAFISDSSQLPDSPLPERIRST